MTSWRYLVGGVLVMVFVALPAYLTRRTQSGRGGGKKIVGVGGGGGHGGSSGGGAGGVPGGRVDEVVAGMQAGTCFSLSALACKIGFILGSQYNRLFILLGVACSAGLTGSGLVFQTRGLKDGNSVVVCTCGNVAQMVTAVIFGVVVLGRGCGLLL
jgi:hypothetical protein